MFKTIIRSFTFALIPFAIAFYMVIASGQSGFHVNVTPGTVIPGASSVADSPATVLEQHKDECWTGTKPANVYLPDAVIWQYPNGHTVFSHSLTGRALNTVFGTDNLAGTPIAFCKGKS